MPDHAAVSSSTDARFDATWQSDRAYLLALAGRMLRDSTAAEDVVQEAFVRLAQVPLDEIDDVRGWLAVVVRRLTLNRLRSAYARHEAIGLDAPLSASSSVDPVDRVTLDDQVQLALAVVLDRLTPAERTAFVLHDIFGLPFDAIGTVVGRSATACRQLASRARRSIRNDAPNVRTDVEPTDHQVVVERFIAACAGGDLSELMAVLDPRVDGHAELLGHGPLVDVEGRPEIARRLLDLFGPNSGRTLVPLTIGTESALVAVAEGRFISVVHVDQADGCIRRFRAFVVPTSLARRPSRH